MVSLRQRLSYLRIAAPSTQRLPYSWGPSMFVVETVADAILGKYIDKLWDKIHDQKYGEATEYVC
jgi:hypothetical protein